ncbi:ABC transporter substrate-binding protein [Paenibacillus hodogayensis]|uniref:ABC transporter substrate-binding protein n=1 Tax=Paenibacillus hodogayensis TaxID=279208 RepID=A0ABV5VW44_9BACL
MKAWREKSVLALVPLIALSLSACGGNETSGKTGQEGKSAGTSAPKEVTLKIGLPGAYDITKKEIIDGFQAKYPHIKLKIDESPWSDFSQKITAQVAAGNPPDVWFQENAVILGYGKRGAAENLAPYIKRDLKQDDYNKGLFAAQTADGSVWGVPHGLNPATLVYNKKLFADNGIPAPTNNWTYQDMLDAAKKLTKDTNGDGKTDFYGFNVASSITVGWFPWSKIYGGGILDETKTKAIVTDPKTIQGLDKWVSVVKEGISPTEDILKAGGGEAQMFGSGKIAMLFSQYSNQLIYAKNYPDLDYDAAPMPKGMDGKRVVPLVTNSWVVYSRASQEVKDAAWQFLQYYLSDEAQETLAKSGNALPVKKSAEAKLDPTTRPQNKKAYADGVAEAGTTTDENPSWQEWRLAAQPIFTEIYQQRKTPEQGAKEIQEKIQAVLDKNK